MFLQFSNLNASPSTDLKIKNYLIYGTHNVLLLLLLNKKKTERAYNENNFDTLFISLLFICVMAVRWFFFYRPPNINGVSPCFLFFAGLYHNRSTAAAAAALIKSFFTQWLWTIFFRHLLLLLCGFFSFFLLDFPYFVSSDNFHFHQ